VAGVANDPAGAFEEPQCPTVNRVVADGLVAAGEFLIAALTLTDVVERSVLRPPVVVSVLVTGSRVGED
jgi:hypothetical protein